MTVLEIEECCDSELFICECFDISHIAHVMYFEEYVINNAKEPKVLYIDIALDVDQNFQSFWKRVAYGISHLIRPNGNKKYCGMAIRKCDIHRLTAILDKFIGSDVALATPDKFIDGDNFRLIPQFNVHKFEDGDTMPSLDLEIFFRKDSFLKRIKTAFKLIFNKLNPTECFEPSIDQAIALKHLAERRFAYTGEADA